MEVKITVMKRVCMECKKIFGCVDTVRNLCVNCNHPKDCQARNSTFETTGVCETCFQKKMKEITGIPTYFRRRKND